MDDVAVRVLEIHSMSQDSTFARNVGRTAVKDVGVSPDPQMNEEELIWHGPLDVVSVKEEPLFVTVYPAHHGSVLRLAGSSDDNLPAQVTPTIHLPVEMRQPFEDPWFVTLRNPLPVGVDPAGAVLVGAGAAVVVVPPDLGSHLIPVLRRNCQYESSYRKMEGTNEGQVDPPPTTGAGWNDPLVTVPTVVYPYQTSFNLPLWQFQTTFWPNLALATDCSCARVYVAVLLGTIPASVSHWKVGRDLN